MPESTSSSICFTVLMVVTLEPRDTRPVQPDVKTAVLLECEKLTRSFSYYAPILGNQSLQESLHTEDVTNETFKSNCTFRFFLHQNQYKMGLNVPVRNLIKAAAPTGKQAFNARHFHLALLPIFCKPIPYFFEICCSLELQQSSLYKYSWSHSRKTLSLGNPSPACWCREPASGSSSPRRVCHSVRIDR